jgi:hypothetical protein
LWGPGKEKRPTIGGFRYFFLSACRRLTYAAPPNMMGGAEHSRESTFILHQGEIVMRFRRCLLFCLAVALAVPLWAQEEGQTFLDAEKAGDDYAVQGEYQGMLKNDDNGDEPWGAQVVALGDGKFDIVGYPGGLPGNGWTRDQEKHKLQGERTAAGIVVAKDNNVTLRINENSLQVTVDGNDIGTLKKVQRQSPTLGKKPPLGAVVLFDGTSADAFERGQIVEENLLAADCETKRKFGDHSLHLEFRTPFKPAARGQARGNSGVYAQNRYEIQVLDSFGLEGENNECGGIYSIAKPLVNMCYPPLTWQTYDIDFTAARYDDQGNKTRNARITVKHNGVVIHDNIELPKGTPGKNPEGPGPDGVYLQGHGNPVVYRNIWVVEK